MPQLPDLTAKLKLDTHDLELAGAKAALLGQALQRELGGTRSAELDRNLKQIGGSVENLGRQMELSGTAAIKWGRTGEVESLRISSATAHTHADFQRLEERTKLLGNSLERDFKRGASAVVKLAEDGTAALGNVTQTMAGAGTEAAGLGARLSSMGAAIGAAVIPVVITLAAALVPTVALLAAFTAGLGAVLAITALAGGAFVALGAGIVLLAAHTQGWLAATLPVPQAQANVANATNAHTAAVLALDQTQKAYNQTSRHTAAQDLALTQAKQKVADTTAKLTTAQQALTAAQTGAVNPLQNLKNAIEGMANSLGARAAPMAAALLNWVTALVPQVTLLGTRLLDWFGPRLDGILAVANSAFNGLLGVIDNLSAGFGRFLDQALARAPTFGPILAQTFNFVVQAAQGLLNNLIRLGDWFTVAMPKYAPVVAAVLSAVGTAMQAAGVIVVWLADQMALLAARHSALTPVMDAVGAGVRQLSEFWKAHGAQVMVVAGILVGVAAQAFQVISQHLDVVTALVIGAGVVLLALGLAFLAVVAAISIAVAAAVTIQDAFQRLSGAVSGLISQAWGAVGGLGAVANAIWSIIGAVNPAIGAVQRLASAISSLPSLPSISLPSLPGLPGAQRGGVFVPGQLFTVGEAGPELGLSLPGGGTAVFPGRGSSQPAPAVPAGASLRNVEGLLAACLRELQKVNDTPSLNADAASRRYAT